MTDDTGMAPPPDGPPNASPSAMETARQNLSSAEQMIALGALALLVGPYLLGSVIFDDYGLSPLELLLTVGVLASLYGVRMRGVTMAVPYAFAVQTLCYALGVLATAEIISFIEGNRVEGIGILTALIYFAGVILMVMGARKVTA